MSDDGGMTAPLDEQARRKPEYREGVWIRLLNDQEWCFPRPVLMYQPSPDDDEAMLEVWSVGDDYGQLIKRIGEVEPTGTEVSKAEFKVIKRLLQLNYNLGPADFAQLIRLSYNEHAPHELLEMGEQIRDVIYGRSRPKEPSDAGSGSPYG